ncbi:hypothetical protein GCM10023168_22370 [Fodinibacter luteus]|uniref:Methyltransferase n=1 Tax=Fodinibacter luteus TaxID=552064 RepID=A0ABP8KHS9_9MICO
MRAYTRAGLTELAGRAGLVGTAWCLPGETGFLQLVMVAHRRR